MAGTTSPQEEFGGGSGPPPFSSVYPQVACDATGSWSAFYPRDGRVFRGRTREEAVRQLPAVKVEMPVTTVATEDGFEARFLHVDVVGAGPSAEEARLDLRRAYGSRLRGDAEFARRMADLRSDPPQDWIVEFVDRNDLEALLLEAAATSSVVLEQGEATDDGWITATRSVGLEDVQDFSSFDRPRPPLTLLSADDTALELRP